MTGAPSRSTSPEPDAASALAVFAIRPFLLLWLSQAATQIGGNMVIYGLTVVIFEATRSNAAVSALLLTFLVPAVELSAVAGVYVDRLDRRLLLIVTNVLRAGAFALMFLAGTNILAIYVLNVAVSAITVFFAPAEAAMIPVLVPRPLLLAANGVFTLTLNAAFPIGFALVGPLVVTLAGPTALLLVIAALYLLAAVFCATLPPSPPVVAAPERAQGALGTVREAERAVGTTFAQLRDGLGFIRQHPNIRWSLTYLGITASLIGVLGVLGPDFATEALGLGTKDFVVVVLPLGFGVVVGILLLNSYGRLVARRRVIEAGLISLGVLLGVLSIAGPIARFLLRLGAATSAVAGVDLSGYVSLLSVVIGIAFLAGIAYAVVAIPAQTQLQEDLPVDVRGRVFGVLNMLVSVSSLLPIVVVGPISDLFGTTPVIFLIAILVGGSGVASVLNRGPLQPAESSAHADRRQPTAPVDPVAVALQSEVRLSGDREGTER
ncbi:MAG TPA: MFS transporter [Candidatus Limnocylindrales bacterium]